MNVPAVTPGTTPAVITIRNRRLPQTTDPMTDEVVKQMNERIKSEPDVSLYEMKGNKVSVKTLPKPPGLHVDVRG